MWNSFMELGAKFLKSAELLHGSWSKVPEFLKKCVQIEPDLFRSHMTSHAISSMD
jgi:hypothetical protein